MDLSKRSEACRICLCDRDFKELMYAQRVIRHLPEFSVLTATDWQFAVDVCVEAHLDFLILDVDSEIGYQDDVLSKLALHLSLGQAGIVFADPCIDGSLRGRRLDASGYTVIQKPISASGIQGLVKRYMGSRPTRQALTPA